MQSDGMRSFLPFVAGALAATTTCLAVARFTAHEQCAYLDRGYRNFSGNLSGFKYSSNAPISRPLENIYRCWSSRPWTSIEYSLILRGEIKGGNQRYIAFDLGGASDVSLLFKVADDGQVTDAYEVATFKVILGS